MPGFTRRFLSDPGLATLTAIEGVVIIDNTPPSQASGVGSGFAVCVAEFEDGAFGVPLELENGGDFSRTFGGFGFTYGGVASNNPCARSRKADGALNAEFWNGNGFLALVNKAFGRLACVRVDTSVGSVNFTPIAFVTGNGNFEWDLEPAQTLILDIGAGPVTSTFNATAATKASGAGTYPTTFAGGEHIQFTIDAGTSQQLGPIDVFFTSADQTQAQVVARLNSFAGYAAFSVGGGNVTNFNGRVRGTSSNVQINAQDAIVGTKVGFNTVIANGTGNVANIDKVTFAEVKAIVEAAVAGTLVERDANNNLRASALGAAPSIQATVASTATAFGFPLGTVFTAAAPADGVIPAGTRVRNAGGVEWVTMLTVTVPAGSAGPFAVKVRHGLDDGTGVAALSGAVNVVPFAVPGYAFSVVNPLPLTAALTEGQLDAAYDTAFNATLNPNAITKQANIIFSARQSNFCRQRGKFNAITASASQFGRVFPTSPPLGTKRSDAKSTTTQPGVGAYRDQRLFYCYPGVNTTVPQIAARGTAGGAGFTADGSIDQHSDSWLAAVMSQLPPEENPGQQTVFMSLVNSVEAHNLDVQNLDVNDYIAFRAAGIVAPIVDDGVAEFQSAVTSVNPQTDQGLIDIDRRRVADFVEDTLGQLSKKYSKKKMTRKRQSDLYGEVNGFLNSLVGNVNQGNQRIDSYRLDAKTRNTKDTLALGLFILVVKVRTLPDMDFVVYEVTVGANVDTTITQLAA